MEQIFLKATTIVKSAQDSRLGIQTGSEKRVKVLLDINDISVIQENQISVDGLNHECVIFIFKNGTNMLALGHIDNWEEKIKQAKHGNNSTGN